MNSLYTLALRQSSALSADLKHLDSLADPASASSSSSKPPASLHGQVNASLAALERTVDDYDAMARREIIDAKREKALSRVARFRQDLAEFRNEYDRVKLRARQQETASNRSELFASSSSAANPYAASTSASASSFSSQHAYGTSADYAGSVHNNARTNHALREHDFVQSTGATLDAYLAQGQAVLGNLANQRDVMKGTQRRLLSAANTLGLSRSTITFIERRTKEDYYILVGGGMATLVCFWMILRYFG
ncbi:uncharacterized protein RHOBADRAFT_37599 [Rhodotorula graminis WP1]|uniref:Protein transport protein BOS1 n=1 Tax=Rhodotorula graminis (strain WP1) TaxID=578459 RepID=A0A194S1S8_RHOGW|nr:uncharacterized protein RHOBADRAFT_37599 [Rhodotorula graminis WP1]KPV74552.1 hypothetical protein RHOBADRAFT_37599 [Rhodotorula graminis WP1]